MINLQTALGGRVDAETESAKFLDRLADGHFLHVLFKGAGDDEISRVNKAVSTEMQDFLRVQNGAWLFGVFPSHAIKVFGSITPRPMDRLGGLESVQTYDILDKGPRDAAMKDIGSYFADGSRVVQLDTGVVVRVSRQGRALPGKWDSVDRWLTSEIERLRGMFDPVSGYRFDDVERTLPR